MIKICMDCKIRMVRVREPFKGEELFLLYEDDYIPVRVIDGHYYGTYGVSNFWKCRNLLTGEIINTYGCFCYFYIEGGNNGR